MPEANTNPDDDDSKIQRQNMKALVFVAVLLVLGTWLVSEFRNYVKREECMEARHRNCDQQDIDAENGK